MAQGQISKQGYMQFLPPKYQRNIKCKYSLDKENQRRKYGIMYLCSTKKTPHQIFLCKTIFKKNLTIEDVEDLWSEATIIQYLLQHPNIIALKDVLKHHKAIYLVMELWKGIKLFDQIFVERSQPEGRSCYLNVHYCRGYPDLPRARSHVQRSQAKKHVCK